MNSADIEGAAPRCVQFSTNRIGTNPLLPVYNLPKVETRAITPPKFIRCQMDVSDIPGARAKLDWHKMAKTKETNKIDDIEGTKAKQRHSPRKNSAGYTSYDYSDITKAYLFESKRTVNPLMPTYTIRDQDNNLFEIGEIKGNNPNILPPERRRGDKSLSLKTQDIIGATGDSKGLGVFAENHKRKDIRTINATEDIPGA